MSTKAPTLKHNELTFQVMVDASPNALILVNHTGKIVYINTYAEQLFQYTRSEIIGEGIEILIPFKFERKHPLFVQSFFNNPKARMMGAGRELYASRKDNSEFPVEIGLNPIVTVDGTLVLASIIDITERKKAEERIRMVVESAPNAMVLMSHVGTITLVNSQTEKLFGYKRKELIGQKIEILIPKKLRDKHPEYRNSYTKKPETRSMGVGRDLFAINKDGDEFPVEIGLNPIETSEGKMVLASVIDITERKKAEKASLVYTRKLEAKNQELEQFTYIASHDLQEPLRSISSLIDILKEDYQQQLDDTALASLEYLGDSAHRMKELIKALLDYSCLGQNTSLKKINIYDIVQQVCNDIEALISANEAEIDIDDLPAIYAYETELRLLFQNLICNAIKFRKPHTTPKIKVSVAKQGMYWKFTVKDNGIGIDPIYNEKIFVIFQKLNGIEQFEGTGIGLAHCKKIVELHDGQIWVESQMDQGSEFHFTLSAQLE